MPRHRLFKFMQRISSWRPRSPSFARELVDLYRMIDAMQNRIDELEKKVNAA